jgi:enoyl-CoA hydratase/carnithine racemase
MVGRIDVTRDGALAWVTLNHVARRNAMTRAMWLELKAVFSAFQHDMQLRCVIVRGAQSHFCAGGDISEYPAFRFDAVQLQHFHEVEVWGGLQAMLDCDVPIVAQVDGSCMGAGVEIASCCDLRLASESAQFGAPIARLGFPMAPKEAALVAAAVGDTTARAMLLAAQVFDAQHLLECDFLLQVLPAQELQAYTEALAQQIITLAPAAARTNKQTFRGRNPTLAPVLQAQAAMKNIASSSDNVASRDYAYANSEEHREGIGAYLAKRNPIF